MALKSIDVQRLCCDEVEGFGTCRHCFRVTGYPHLTACCSHWSRNAVADPWIWQSRPLRIKWQYWIAPGGRIIVHRECRQWQHNVGSSAHLVILLICSQT